MEVEVRALLSEIGKLTPSQFWTLLENSPDDAYAQDLLYFRCLGDVGLFAQYFFPHYCQDPFNQFHRDLFEDWRAAARGLRRVYGAPRGYSKSTFLTLIKPIHDICYGLEDFICIFSNTQSQAVGKLKDIRRELFGNALLLDNFSIRPLSRVPAETQFPVRANGHDTMLHAYGAGTEIRGIRFGATRPTKVILDDVEHSEEIYNEEIRRKYQDWYFDVVSYLGTKDTNVDFVGTILHYDSLLMNLSKNASYSSKIYKSVISWAEREDLWQEWRKIYTDLENPERLARAQEFYDNNKDELLRGTQVLWPERESYLYLMQELVEKGKRSFYKEKQNSPLGAEDCVFDEIHYYREVPGGIEIERSKTFISWDDLRGNCYGTIDPSTGQSKARKGKLGDFSCILTGFEDPWGRLLVHHDFTKRVAPTKYIGEIFELHEKYDYQKFGVETNLYRNLLLPNIIDERNRRETQGGKSLKIGFYDIEQTDNKEKRIYTLEPKVTHGWILFNRALSKEFMTQIEEFPRADHDDCPDALEMLWGLMHKRYKAAPISINAMGTR